MSAIASAGAHASLVEPPGRRSMVPPSAVRAAGTEAKVLVLNATHEPINVCTVRRAAVLLLKRRAVVIEHNGGRLRSERLEVEQPAVIRLAEYVAIPRDPARRKITRRAVLARDRWECQYCGSRRQLTIDHVLPRSRGGGSSWDNVLTSCAPCNRTKGDNLPHEARMHPRTVPGPPGPQVFIEVACPRVPAAWRSYLDPWTRVPRAA